MTPTQPPTTAPEYSDEREAAAAASAEIASRCHPRGSKSVSYGAVQAIAEAVILRHLARVRVWHPMLSGDHAGTIPPSELEKALDACGTEQRPLAKQLALLNGRNSTASEQPAQARAADEKSFGEVVIEDALLSMPDKPTPAPADNDLCAQLAAAKAERDEIGRRAVAIQEERNRATDDCNRAIRELVAERDALKAEASDWHQRFDVLNQMAGEWQDEVNRLRSQLAAVTAERDALRAQVPRWVSVKERMPEHEGDYLVVCPQWSSPHEVAYNKRHTYQFPIGFSCQRYDGEEWEIVTGVTHWMELPAPPATDETKGTT